MKEIDHRKLSFNSISNDDSKIYTYLKEFAFCDKHLRFFKFGDRRFWYVNINLDACHSGSALQQADTWVQQKQLFQLFQRERYQNKDENTKEIFVCAFDQECDLDLTVYSSTNAKQEANDAGEGIGGKWTNFFLAKGKTPLAGKKIEGIGYAGAKSYQTTQHLHIKVLK